MKGCILPQKGLSYCSILNKSESAMSGILILQTFSWKQRLQKPLVIHRKFQRKVLWLVPMNWKRFLKLVVMAHTYNPNTWEAKEEDCKLRPAEATGWDPVCLKERGKQEGRGERSYGRKKEIRQEKLNWKETLSHHCLHKLGRGPTLGWRCLWIF